MFQVLTILEIDPAELWIGDTTDCEAVTSTVDTAMAALFSDGG